MAIQTEDGIDWEDVIQRIETLPRGEARRVNFISGNSMAVEHHDDGTVRVLLSGDDGDGQWIYPTSLQMLAILLRSGVGQRPRS